MVKDAIFGDPERPLEIGLRTEENRRKGREKRRERKRKRREEKRKRREEKRKEERRREEAWSLYGGYGYSRGEPPNLPANLLQKSRTSPRRKSLHK